MIADGRFVLNDVDCMMESQQHGGFDESFTDCLGANYANFVKGVGVTQRRDVAFAAVNVCLLMKRANSIIDTLQKEALAALYAKAADYQQPMALGDLAEGLVGLLDFSIPRAPTKQPTTIVSALMNEPTNT